MSHEKLLRSKRADLTAARQEVAALEREVEKLIQRVQEAKSQDALDELAAYTGGLNLIPLRDGLVGEHTGKDLEDWVGEVVCILGRGPWEEHEFKEFLEQREFVVTDASHAFSTLVVGRAIDEEAMIDLRAILDFHIEADEPLTVLSQELLLYALCKLENPLETFSEDELLQLADGHGGLTSVLEYDGFQWPNGDLEHNLKRSDGIYEFDPSVLSAESPLHRIGYTVAEGRLLTAERWKKLREMYEADGDALSLSSDEQRVWGLPRTQQRLYAMARHISWLIGFRGESAPFAAERWRKDLTWLKETYYRVGMKFSWPFPKN